MFLILGAPNCKYCVESKKLLESHSLNYLYCDLTLIYGAEWRSIFNDLKPLIKSQKTIPIIFHSKNIEDQMLTIPESFQVEDILKKWVLVGTFFDLEEHVDNLDISIDNDY
jgi:glutaredoxin